MGELRNVKEAESRVVQLNEPDAETLLFEWLNSLIYFFDVEMLLFKRFDIGALTDNHLEATCYGEKYDPSRHHLKIGVKSATFHMLKVDKKKNRVQVIFDV
jgi:SHS2 domain-containing protein